jgi:hypothetical protein
VLTSGIDVGAPTDAHEQRVGELETLAILAGYTTPVDMPWRLRPDVLRGSPATGGLFIGDAKETERPSCADTLRRLCWYVTAAVGAPSGGEITMVLAVPRRRYDAGFEQLLLQAAAGRLRCSTPAATTMIGDTAVVAVQAVVP